MERHRYLKFNPKVCYTLFGEHPQARFTDYGAVVCDLGPYRNLTLVKGDIALLLSEACDWKRWGFRIVRGQGWKIDAILLEA